MGIMLLAGLASQAQTGWLATTPLPDNVKSTIVRHYLDEQSISYIQYNDTFGFNKIPPLGQQEFPLTI